MGAGSFQQRAGLVPAGVQHTLGANGGGHFGIMLGVADHHSVGRVDAGAAQIVGAKLYLAYAVNVRKAEQLGKTPLRPPAGNRTEQL